MEKGLGLSVLLVICLILVVAGSVLAQGDRNQGKVTESGPVEGGEQSEEWFDAFEKISKPSNKEVKKLGTPQPDLYAMANELSRKD